MGRRAGALTDRGAARIRELTRGSADVMAIPPAFLAELPAADHPPPGDPPLVLLGSGGWLPKREGTLWFLTGLWPEVRSRVPGAVLHLYAAEPEVPNPVCESVETHPGLIDSRDAFAPNAIVFVPLRIASGIRRKILEASTRGSPVVTNPKTAGLEAEPKRDLLLADDGPGFAIAVGRLASEPHLQTLAARHHPAAGAGGSSRSTGS